MLKSKDAERFENIRPKLLGLAYRILGVMADAEDAVQDTFIKWANTQRDEIENPESWLTTLCTRRCLDLLRSAHRSRTQYVGAWLPEPIHNKVEHEMECALDLASSLQTAFLLMLERLTPKERAAYLLYDIFDTPYEQVAEILNIQSAACRKLVSRAKANIDQANIRHRASAEQQDSLLAAFQGAITSGVTTQLSELLSNDIQLTADGGGKVPAVREILQGKADVIQFLTEKLHDYWSEFSWEAKELNSEQGIVLKNKDRIEATVTFAFSENGQASDIFIMRNPDKLLNLGGVQLH